MRYASLRQGLVGAWCPSVSGPYGYRLPDLSGYGNHGTLTNMDPPNDWVVSGGKGALDFATPTTTKNINTNSTVINGHVMTLSGWFRITSGQLQDLVGRRYSSASDYATSLLAIGIDNVYFLQSTNGGSWDTLCSYPWSPDSKWHHILGFNNGVIAKLYLDGQYVHEDSTPSTSFGSPGNESYLLGNARLGGGVSGSLSGSIDDIRIYNRALTEQEIRLLASERGIGLKPERQRNRYSAPALPSRNRSSRFLGFPS